MNTHKDSFTDPSQVGELNEKVWKTIIGGHEIIQDMKPELDGTLPLSQSTVIVDEAEFEANEIASPTEWAT